MKALKKDKGKKNKGSDAEIQTSKDKLPQENDISILYTDT